MATPWLLCALLACGDDAASEPEPREGDGAGGRGRIDASAGSGARRDGGGAGGSARDGGDPARDADTDAGTTVRDAGGERDATTGGDPACPPGASGERPADYLAQWHSGSRLRALTFASAGAPDVFAGFYDTTLNVECDFVKATDGELRCLPRSSALESALGFADAACREAVLQVSAACGAQPAYARTRTECFDVLELRRLTPLAAATMLYRGSPGSCQASGSSEPPAAKTFVAHELPALSGFVRGSARALPGVCQASLRIVEAEDGAYAPLHPFDVASGASCRRANDLDQGCIPERLAYTDPTLFSDSACTMPALLADRAEPATCSPPQLIGRTNMPDFQRVAGLFSGDVYSQLGSECKPAREREWIGAVYAIGEDVPPEQWAKLGVRERGTGRLKLRVLEEAGVALIASEGRDGAAVLYYDSELAHECIPRRMADGSTRCVAADLFGNNLQRVEFNDPACSEPLRACSGDDCPGKLGFDASIDAATCAEPLVTGVWKIRARSTGYYRNDGGSCMPAGSVQPDRWLIDAVDVTTLAAIERRVRD